MIGSLFTSITRFLVRNKLVTLGLLTIILSVLIVGVKRLELEEDIYSVFPEGEEFQEFSKVIQENNLNRQVIFSFKAAEEGDENYTLLDDLSEKLINDKRFDGALGNYQFYREVQPTDIINYLQDAAKAYVTKDDYQLFGGKIKADSITHSLENVRNFLQGGNALFLGDYYSKDPLNLFGKQLKQFNIRSDSSTYTIEDGIVYSASKDRVFFFADLLIDNKENVRLENFDRDIQDFVTKNGAKIDLDVFGVYQISLANAEQVKKDTTFTTIISVSLILLLLIVYYRSLLIPVFFILPAGFGMLCGLGLTGYVNPQVNVISLATASILMGIVLDYSFHFYTHYKHSGSIIDTVKDLSSPMLVGSFTTVAAFAALIFTDSIVLKNFGIIALFTLMGSALFTLTFLPAILEILRIKLKPSERDLKNNKTPRLVVRLFLLAIIAFTTFSLLTARGINFDGDLNNLSFHPTELKDKEHRYTGVSPDSEKRIYLFANGKTAEEAKVVSEQLYDSLVKFKEPFQIAEVLSPSPFLISDKKWTEGENNWNEFWKSNPTFKSTFTTEANRLGFATGAFDPFLNSLDEQSEVSSQGHDIIVGLGMSPLVHFTGNKNSLLTSITVSTETVEGLKNELRSIEGIYVMDIGEMATGMIMSVRNDFDFLLFFSSLVVFFSLLIVYGRIELALFAFFPLMLAWVWILGVTTFFDIQFNFVNIVIATFIFGLGDDFSIFITDGLLQKYRMGKDNVNSYRSAIVLSGVTTIIGTGALVFAKHPAVNSIAVISVIGITAVLLITLFLQPLIFNWFVTRRTKKKRSPITFFTGLYSCMLFTYFFLGSVFLSIVLIVFVIPFPAKKVKKQAFMNYLVSKLAKSTYYATFHVYKEIRNEDKLNYKEPTILVANHVSFIDILAVLMLSPKTIIMVKSWVYNSPIFGLFIRYSGYIFAENGAEDNLKMVQQKFDEGYSLVIFPEGTRSTDGEIHRFHKGAFVLSKRLNVPIQPLLIYGLNEVNPKNDLMIHPGKVSISIYDKIYPSEEETDKDYTKRVQKLMRKEFDILRKDFGDARYWFPTVMHNYVLKGPVLEWYVRIKYRLERKNFDFYESQIGDRQKIYDIGCGYGYLSYFLHYKNVKRSIIGLDYDEEKVLTAQHGIKRSENLQFETADIRSYEFTAADVIFVNDVLHYLEEGEQMQVLENLVAQLQENGRLFVRDGIADDSEKFKKTQLSEVLSTKVFKFNKTTNDLTFLNVEKMKAFANKHHLDLEIVSHSDQTSNTLFIFRK